MNEHDADRAAPSTGSLGSADVRPAPSTRINPAQPGRGDRDRYFDLLRALAIVRVVAFHMFPVAWLSMVFPAMGVMFALGGSLMARSVDRSAEQAITGRLRRLLPALWAMAAVLVPAMLVTGWEQRPDWPSMLLWALPIAVPPGSQWAGPVTSVLWYLVTYLWLVLLSPALLRLYRRARLATLLLPLVMLAAMDVIPWFFGDTAASVVTDVLTFASCWVLGFAHRDGDLHRVPRAVLVAVAAISTTAGLGWVLSHPVDDGVDLASAPLAYGIYSVGFVLVLLRFPLPMQWLTRRRLADGLVNLVNARAVTIYLWHNAAITASFPVGDFLQVWRLGGSFMMVGYLGVAAVLLALTVALLGWVEDLAARRSVRVIPWRQVPASQPRPATPSWSGPPR